MAIDNITIFLWLIVLEYFKWFSLKDESDVLLIWGRGLSLYIAELSIILISSN